MGEEMGEGREEIRGDEGAIVHRLDMSVLFGI